MLTDKPKRKNSPRLRRILIAVVIVTLLMLGGLVAFPHAEIRLNQWLENDPFTPMCNAGHLELAYESNQDGYVRLYTMRGDGSQKTIVVEANELYPASDYTTVFLSPDGYWLMYIDNTIAEDDDTEDLNYNFGYVLVNRATLHQTFQGAKDLYGMSPNGRFFLDDNADYREGEGGFIANIVNSQPDTTDIHEIIQSYPKSFGFINFSPDENRIIYRQPSGETVVVYVDENFAQDIVFEGDAINSISWSPNGQYFLFAAENLLWVAEFDQNTGHLIEVRQLASAMVSSLRWSWDSTQIAYFVEAGKAVIQQVDTGEIFWHFDAEFLYDWSENGLIIGTIDPMYPYTPASQILELRVANVAKQTIDGYFARATGYTNATAQWTPDGQQIFYTFDYDDFFLTTPESDPDGVLADFHIPSSNLDFGAMWTPDNQYLTYEGDNHWLYLLNLDTHESCRVVKGNTQAPTNYDWRLLPEEQ